jgi:hypothetical protein
MAESRAARPPDRRQGLPWKITVQSGAKRRPKDASAASALDGDLCAARECPARGGRPNQFSRSRSCGCVAAGTACLAGAGLLTWWRRRAQRAPARQGSACRPPRSRRGARRPDRLWQSSRASSRTLTVVSRSCGELAPGLDDLARPEGVPLMIVKKVLTPYGRLSGLSAAKPLAALCRVGPIEACPDGAGDVVASDAPVGGESTDDV